MRAACSVSRCWDEASAGRRQLPVDSPAKLITGSGTLMEVMARLCRSGRCAHTCHEHAHGAHALNGSVAASSVPRAPSYQCAKRQRLQHPAHRVPSVNVSPDAHSTPNMATMSPAPAWGPHAHGHVRQLKHKSTHATRVHTRLACLANVLQLISVHAHQARHLDALARGHIHNVVTLLQRPCVPPHMAGA